MMQVSVPPIPPLPPIPPEVTVLPPWVTLPPHVVGLIAIGFFAACTIVLWPLMRAIGRRLEGRGAMTDPSLRADLDQLRERLAEVDSLQHRMAELEERLDFAERLLAQKREADRLGRGGAG